MDKLISAGALDMDSFLAQLGQGLPDPRDPRGRRHDLTFTLAAVAVAILCQCQTVSSIHRFIRDRLAWLVQLTGRAAARCISRAHLPRLLDGVDRAALSGLISRCFAEPAPAGWVAIDGKTLRGSSRGEARQAVVLAVGHDCARELAQTPQVGRKSSEITVVREFLAEAGLDSARVTLDALHCNPKTFAQVAQAGGAYLVQVKDNQSELLHACTARAVLEPPLAESTLVDKGHGRVTQCRARLFPLRASALDPRWAPCKATYLVELLREVYTPRSQASTREVAYYVTNSTSPGPAREHLEELQRAVRGHWRVEANNWIRDVTLGEDAVRVQAGNQAQVLALLRGLVITLLRKAKEASLVDAMERLRNVPGAVHAWLLKVKFL